MLCVLVGILSLCLLATSASAELGVCFDAARPAGQQFYWGYRSPAQIAQDVHCTLITKASGQTQAQQALIESTVTRPLLTPPTQPATKYLHVVPDPPTAGGLAVLMDAAGMDAIDAAIASAKAPYEVAQGEVQDNDICQNNTLQDISNYWSGTGRTPPSKREVLMQQIATLDGLLATWDTKIQPLAAGAPKDAMIAARNAAGAQRDATVAHMNMFIQDAEKHWRYTCARTFLRP